MEIQACTGIHVCSRGKGREWWESCSGCAAVGRGCRGESGSQLHCKASFTVSRHQLLGCWGNSPTSAEGREHWGLQRNGSDGGRGWGEKREDVPCECEVLTLLELRLQIFFHLGERERSSSLSSTAVSLPHPLMQPDMEAEKNYMPTADCSFIAAYHQHFCPKLPSYCTQNWAISIQLQLEEALPEWLGFWMARSPLARPVPGHCHTTRKGSCREDRVLHLAAVSSVTVLLWGCSVTPESGGQVGGCVEQWPKAKSPFRMR